MLWTICYAAGTIVVIALASQDVSGAVIKTEASRKVNLPEFLAQTTNGLPLPGTNLLLEPHWIGTVKRAYLRGGKDVYGEDKPTNIRFTHLMMVKAFDREPRLVMARAREGSDGRLRYTGSEALTFMNQLPSAKVVSEAKNLDDLLEMFGPQHGWTDGWGSEERMHWTEGWTWFTVDAKDRVRYLGVFAHVSGKKGQKPADIDILRITEGFFRPAKPNSAPERAMFKTPEELFIIEQETRRKARAVYPHPLRALVEARESPDDSDLVAYKLALNNVRRNPPPQLFRQFAEWVHEGTVEIKIMLETLLFDYPLELDKWEEQKRRIALRSLAEALPHVKTSMDLDNLVVFLLQSQGGGRLRVQVPGTDAVVEVEAHRFADGTGSSATFGSQNVSAENMVRAAEKCRDALRERYPNLR